MSIFVDPNIEMDQYSEFLHTREGTLRAALEARIRVMTEAEKEARAAYEAGQADPEVKAQQDASVITNYGYKYAADMFKGNAEGARNALTELDDLVLGD